MRLAAELDGRVATFTIDSPEAAVDLCGALEALAYDDSARVAVIDLTTEGGAWPELPAEEARRQELAALPTIAAVAGDVRGGRLGLALSCDILVAEEGSTFVFSAFGTRRTLALVHRNGSIEIYRRGGSIDAATALDLGLVSELAPRGGAAATAAGVAAVIASRGPIATRLAKEAIWRGLDLPLEQALRFETDLTLLLQTTKDRAVGVRAFLEKRPPAFHGE